MLRTPGTPRTLKNWEIEGENWEIKWEKKDQLLLRNHEIIDLSDAIGTQKEKNTQFSYYYIVNVTNKVVWNNCHSGSVYDFRDISRYLCQVYVQAISAEAD